VKVESMFQAIFNAEVTRLYDTSLQGPLDMADIIKLEKLVGAHAKFKPAPPLEADLSDISTEELLNGLKPRANASSETP